MASVMNMLMTSKNPDKYGKKITANIDPDLVEYMNSVEFGRRFKMKKKEFIEAAIREKIEKTDFLDDLKEFIPAIIDKSLKDKTGVTEIHNFIKDMDDMLRTMRDGSMDLTTTYDLAAERAKFKIMYLLAISEPLPTDGFSLEVLSSLLRDGFLTSPRPGVYRASSDGKSLLN